MFGLSLVRVQRTPLKKCMEPRTQRRTYSLWCTAIVRGCSLSGMPPLSSGSTPDSPISGVHNCVGIAQRVCAPETQRHSGII